MIGKASEYVKVYSKEFLIHRELFKLADRVLENADRDIKKGDRVMEKNELNT